MPGHGQARRAAGVGRKLVSSARRRARGASPSGSRPARRTAALAPALCQLAVPRVTHFSSRGVEQPTAPSTARSRLVGLAPLPPERRAAAPEIAGVTDSWGRVTSQSLSVRLAGKMGHPERPRRLHPR